MCVHATLAQAATNVRLEPATTNPSPTTWRVTCRPPDETDGGEVLAGESVGVGEHRSLDVTRADKSSVATHRVVEGSPGRHRMLAGVDHQVERRRGGCDVNGKLLAPVRAGLDPGRQTVVIELLEHPTRHPPCHRARPLAHARRQRRRELLDHLLRASDAVLGHALEEGVQLVGLRTGCGMAPHVVIEHRSSDRESSTAMRTTVDATDIDAHRVRKLAPWAINFDELHTQHLPSTIFTTLGRIGSTSPGCRVLAYIESPAS
jgi:hypothetical protein